MAGVGQEKFQVGAGSFLAGEESYERERGREERVRVVTGD